MSLSVPAIPSSSTATDGTEQDDSTLDYRRYLQKLRRNRQRQERNRYKVVRCWEFLRDLLLNPEYCPSLIRWENKEEHTFRFVRPEEVARMWGMKRLNRPMNFTRFSLILRYYNNYNVIVQVLGEDLVYKFDPKVVDTSMITANRRLTDELSYYYKNKILMPILGKRLMYTFGPHGVGWRKNIPIMQNKPYSENELRLILGLL